MATPTLEDAVVWLAASCDGAKSSDGKGFNKFDAAFGTAMAEKVISGGQLSDQEYRDIYKMLGKYNKQLVAAGMDIRLIPEKRPMTSANEFDTVDFLKEYKCTPNGNADRFVDKFGDDILFSIKGKNGTFLLWNGNIWKPDDTLEIERRGREIIDDIYAEAAQLKEESRRKALSAHAVKSDNITQIRAMLEAVKSDVSIARRYQDFNINKRLLGLPGGEGVILELNDSGYEIRPARKEDMVTLAVGSLPASKDNTRPPKRWLKLLDVIFPGRDGKPDEALIEYIQKLMGYSLLGSQDKQLFVVFYGTGCNGKSTLIRIWFLLLKDYATYADITTFSKKLNESDTRPDLQALFKKRLVAVVEGGKTVKLNETLINQWTGGQEPITSRDLYEKTVSEWPQGLISIVANNKPVITETNLGIWRRVRLIPFCVNLKKVLKPEEMNDNFADDVFADEGDLIFRWVLEGYDLYKKEGLESPSTVEEATKSYESESNSLLQFCNDMLKEDDKGTIAAINLIEKYQTYCNDEGLTAMDTRSIKGELIKIYDGTEKVTWKRSNAGIIWNGIRIRQETEFV